MIGRVVSDSNIVEITIISVENLLILKCILAYSFIVSEYLS